VSAGNRVLVTTLTKASAEKLHQFIASRGFRVRYIHSTPVSSARKLAADVTGEDKTFSHPADFCENLADLCHRITEKERRLMAAADARDEKRIEEIRGQLDRLYRQFIYV